MFVKAQRMAAAALAATFVFTAASSAAAAKTTAPTASIVIEAETGQVLSETRSGELRPQASLVKMMLTLVVFDRVEKGEAQMDAPIRASAYASQMGGSQVYLAHGETFTLGELMKAIEMASANDACVAVAEGLVGSAEAMTVLMNERARELGMKDTNYVNVHGLPESPDSMSTARDMAMLARELIAKHPSALKWSSTVKDTFRNGTFDLYNTNKRFLENFPGADGLKTGYHSKAGFNLVATAERNGIRLISAVLGASSDRERARESARLLGTAFATHDRRAVAKAGDLMPSLVYVEGSAHAYAPVRIAQDIEVFAKRSDFDKIVLEMASTPKLKAPVKKGDSAGLVAAKLNGKTLATAPIEVNADIKKASIVWRVWNWRTPRPTKGDLMPRDTANKSD